MEYCLAMRINELNYMQQDGLTWGKKVTHKGMHTLCDAFHKAQKQSLLEVRIVVEGSGG